VNIKVTKAGNKAELYVDSVSLAGDVAKELKQTAMELIEAGFINLSLDLRRTDYVDSSGVGKILFLQKKLTKLEGSFRITRISGQLYSFLESLAITKVMDIAAPN
jgi:anti-anti-sigma factor